tara:strand:+ start:36 stop:509 length:474 start_codon:yes stop_codon:yes gene_type:complete
MTNMQVHEKWMRYALAEAVRAYDNDEVPVGAIIIKDEIIIAKGYNQKELLKDATAHAEIIAITSAANSLQDWRLNDCTMYVTMEPCAMCAGAIINSRIKSVYFGVYDQGGGCCGSLYQICHDPRMNHQSTVRGGILEQESKSLLQDFFRLKRKPTNQ